MRSDAELATLRYQHLADGELQGLGVELVVQVRPGEGASARAAAPSGSLNTLCIGNGCSLFSDHCSPLSRFATPTPSRAGAARRQMSPLPMATRLRFRAAVREAVIGWVRPPSSMRPV